MKTIADWDTLQGLFEEGIGLGHDDRHRLLAGKLAGRPDLQAELQALWAQESEEDPFQSVRLLARGVTAQPTEEDMPTDFSRYEILERIGRGGMGVVYKARQKQVDRIVALKILPLGHCTPERLERFRGEQRALALIDHPNVTRVYDCGETPEGQPFYTMDFLEGAPITTWCDEHRLDIPARLQLMHGVCEGLARAHGKGIIHRDINPNNVMVSRGPDGPVARLIDFGIAKFKDRTVQTKTGSVLGTPGYLSPEQAAGGNEAEVDVRSDVFNLGALLYELCTGTAPWAEHLADNNSLDHMLRVVREMPPRHPARAVHRSQPDTARTHRTSPHALAKTLNGELGRMIMKATALKPEDRYQDCRALIRDLDHFRQGLPLDAMPPDRFYRLRKLAWYHRRPLFLGIAFLALLLAAITAISAAFFRTRRAELEARETLERLQAVQGFTLGIFEEVDPSRAGRSVTGSELLERAERKLAASYRNRPELEAPTRMVLGRAWRGLGLAARAEDQFRRAYALNKERLGETAEATLLSLEAAAFSSSVSGNLLLAGQRYEICHRGFLTRFGPDDPRTLRTASGMALVLGLLGEHSRAVDLFKQTLQRQEALLGADDSQTRATRHNLISLLISAGKLEEAETLLAVTLRQLDFKGDTDHPQALKARHNQCFLLEKKRRRDEAAVCYRDVLARREIVLGRFHPDTLMTRNNLAVSLGDGGKPKDALALLGEVLDDPQRPASEHPVYARLEHNLGHYLLTTGRRREAEPILEKVLEKRIRTLGPANHATLRTEWTLGEVWLARGHREKALATFKAVIAKAESALGADHADTRLYKRVFSRM
ncbi:MAG: serine/threonine-protein kinase [Acidobacteriota bacterium]|nr:serine/threonine-protein kinase [Acidobacteriota bacterium]